LTERKTTQNKTLNYAKDIEFMEMGYFTTQFGEQIPIIPGYAASIGREQKLSQELIDRFTYTPGKSLHIDVTNFGKDVMTYALVMEMLESVGLLPETGYRRALDIGGQEGIHPALFRAHYAEHVTSVDLMDGSDPDLTDKMRRIIWNQRKQQALEYLYHDNYISGPVLRRLFPGRVSRRLQSLCDVVPSKRHFYNFRFKRDLAVDEFVVGDFVEKIDGQFDIILSFLTMCLMPYKKAIPKISELLPTRGVFAFISRYTYGPGFLTPLSGDFPYFDKRLTLADIKKYYQEYKPHELPFVDRLYAIHDPDRPTIHQYAAEAYRHGLHLVAYRPLMVPFLSESVDSKWREHGALQNNIDAEQILRDIRHFRPEITLQDLFTSYFVMVFVKR